MKGITESGIIKKVLLHVGSMHTETWSELDSSLAVLSHWARLHHVVRIQMK